MWPFRSADSKKVQAAQLYKARMESGTKLVCKRWLTFIETMPFESDVALPENISLFIDPMMLGLRESFPELANSPDEAMLFLIIQGVYRSESHPDEQLLQAFRELGIEM